MSMNGVNIKPRNETNAMRFILCLPKMPSNATKLKQKEKNVMFSVNIAVMEDESIQVDGAINDLLLFTRIIAGAQHVVADYHSSIAKNLADIEANRKAKEGSKIISLGDASAQKSAIEIVQ